MKWYAKVGIDFIGIESIKAAGMYAVGVGAKEAMAKADMFVAMTEDLSLSVIQLNFNKQ